MHTLWNVSDRCRRRGNGPALGSSQIAGLFVAASVRLPIAALLCSTALSPAFAGGSLPSGQNVVAGDASVVVSGPVMTVTQGSDKAIVNWNSFSIGRGNAVNFVQLDASSAILNRVTGSTTSSIAGALTGNGQVYLVNPNGVAITKTGTVKVGGGFVGSTLDIADGDFLSGSLTFKGSGASSGVSNDGVVAVGRGGYAALIAGTVKNSGLIAVPLGKVGMGSGEQATLDLSGDGFLQVAVPTMDGAEGEGALIETAGTVSAGAGTVVMAAATAQEAARYAINLSGVVEANSVGGRNGAIVLGGGSGGTVRTSGRVHAKSDSGKGGSIAITGRAIELAGADVDASGAAGGGTIRVGGDRKGGGVLQRAETTAVDAATTIRADATDDGSGGDVVVWSDDLTTFDGLITAHGASSGAGGKAEVSGKAKLAYAGFTDLSGPGGFGTLLLDPYNITISNGTASSSSGTAATGDDSVISVSTVTSALSSANLVITTNSGGAQDGNITVADPISWSADTTLTLAADNDITINADISATGDSAGLILNSGRDYVFNNGASATLTGGSASLEIDNANYTLIRSMAEIDEIDSTGTGGRYALAQDLDASGTTYSDALVAGGSGIFTGTFAGLGHTISNIAFGMSNIIGSGDGKNNFGLFGRSSGTIRDIGLLDAHMTITHVNLGKYGLLVGWNKSGGAVLNAYSTGWIDAAVSGSSGNPTIKIGGLVGYTYENAVIANSHSTADIAAHGGGGILSMGGLVGASNGKNESSHIAIVDSYATGTVSALTTGTGDIYAGGLVGSAEQSDISTSYATGDVQSTGVTNRVYAGGLIGLATGHSGDTTYLTQVYASGDATATNTVNEAYAGGLVGRMYTTDIRDSYALGSATASGTTVSGAGGLVGWDESSTIITSYARGLTTANPATDVYGGGLVGYRLSAGIFNSFFDTDTTGQSLGSGANTQNGLTGLTTAEFQDAASFMALAESNLTDPWDFDSVWAPPSDGYHPVLYAMTPVVWVDGFNTSSTYGDTTAAVTAINKAHGGTASYVFGLPNDSLALTGLIGTNVDSDPTVSAGSSAVTSSSTIASAASSDGVAYRILLYGTQNADVAKAALTITADDAAKFQGQTANLTYSVSGLLNSDSVAAVTLTSPGSAAGANVGTYAIAASDASGAGVSNYAIDYVEGTLTVSAAPGTPYAGVLSSNDLSPANGPSSLSVNAEQESDDSILDGITCDATAGSVCGGGN